MSTLKEDYINDSYTAECLGLDTSELPTDAFPLTYSTILREQQKDKDLLAKLKANTNPRLQLTTYRGGGKIHSLITFDDKIVIPSSLQQRVVQWYHTQLCHPGEKRMEETI